jgi:gliding motility-associated-like protein
MDSITQTVVVNPMPVTTVAASPDTILCEGGGGSVQLNATGGATYQWFASGVLIPGVTGSSLTVTEQGLYSVKAISASGCMTLNDASITISLVKRPTANFIYNGYCTNVPVTFVNQSNVLGAGLVVYEWSDNIGNTSNLVSPLFTYSNIGAVSMKLKVISQSCPLISDSIIKNLNIESPRSAIRLPLVDVVKNDPTMLRARDFGASYLWSSGNLLSDSTIVNPILTTIIEQEFKITITAPSSCITVDTLLVRIYDNYTVFIPNVFSPNGDGQNDKLTINLVGIKDVKYFRIFNRAGKLVYETNNTNQGWDGRFKGQNLPIDSYMWVIDAISVKGYPIRERGVVSLLR